jgi:thioredoxin-related protein
MKKILPLIVLITLLTSGILTAQQNSPAETEWVSMEDALLLARESGKKILIDVYDQGCPYCRRMHSQVYPDSKIVDVIDDYFIGVKVDVNSDASLKYLGQQFTEKQFASALRITGVPTAFFMNGDGEIIGQQPGFIPAETFLKLLKFVGSDAYLTQNFSEYSVSN